MDNEEMRQKIKEHVRLKIPVWIWVNLIGLALWSTSIFLMGPGSGRSMVLLIGLYVIAFILLPSWDKKIKMYIDRNIVGYNIWFYCKKSAPAGEADIEWNILKRSAVLDEKIAAIILPLGGWFNRPRLWFKADLASDGKSVNRGWKVECSNRIGGSVIKETASPCDILQYVSITFTTRTAGERISMPLISALKFLDFMKSEYCELFPFREIVVRTFMAQIVLKKKNETSMNVLVETAERLQKTKRFVKSKEGAALRQWLEEEISKIDPFRSANMRGRTIAA